MKRKFADYRLWFLIFAPLGYFITHLFNTGNALSSIVLGYSLASFVFFIPGLLHKAKKYRHYNS